MKLKIIDFHMNSAKLLEDYINNSGRPLNMTKEEAEKLLKIFNERYPSMKDWRQRIMKRAKEIT